MRLALRIALPGVLALAILASAAGPPPARKPARASDQLDYLFLASDRPVLIRLHVRLGEKPYSAGWEAWMDKLFTWFDKDGDGFLSPAEAARLPHPNFLSQQIQGSIGGRSQPVAFAQLDANKDGKVSKEEFRAFFRNNGLSPLRFYNQNYQATQAKGTNDAIYKRLGVEPTGKLTKEALARLPDLVRTLDENEDELLSAQELRLDTNDDPYGYARPRPRRPKMAPAVTQEPGLLEIQPEAVSSSMGYPVPPVAAGSAATSARSTGPKQPAGSRLSALAQQTLAHYDKAKKGKLSPKDIGFDAALFAQLDSNKDGFLDAGELVGFFQREPDMVFRARTGPSSKNTVISGLARLVGMKSVAPDRLEVLNAKSSPLARKIKRSNGENLSFNLGDSRFDCQVNEGQSGRYNGARQFYLQQFDSLKEKKGYVDKAQEKDNAMYPYLFFIFPQADRNADGKLTRKELEAWMDLTAQGGNCFVTIQVEDIGRNLFNVIDKNGDSQLSMREMRTAWERVKPLCKDGKGLEQKDLPRALRITVGQGNTYYRGGNFAVTVYGRAMGAQSKTTGSVPAWFIKMDRNNDGDISPKEWLGTEEEFRAIDTDGDGLISADEARQFEARLKKKSEAKKTEEKKPEEKKPEQLK
jgi:Ca2+-binding EF-hand superfamily protein